MPAYPDEFALQSLRVRLASVNLRWLADHPDASASCTLDQIYRLDQCVLALRIAVGDCVRQATDSVIVR